MLSQENAALHQNLSASKETHTQLTAELNRLLEQIKLMNQRRFASSSEANLLQQNLFDELAVADSNEQQTKKTVTYTRNATNKPKRTPLPEHLERVEIMVDIDDADKICACCEKTIRPKYVCNSKKCTNEGIFIAPLVPRILPKSYASASLIADILTKKYVDHIPLYRQQQAWKRLAVEVPRNTMCGWLMNLLEEVRPLYRLLCQHILRHTIIHVDETTVQVLGEPNRDDKQKSYLWA